MCIIYSPLLAVYPISAGHRMRDMIAMTTENANIILYHNFTLAALETTCTYCNNLFEVFEPALHMYVAIHITYTPALSMFALSLQLHTCIIATHIYSRTHTHTYTYTPHSHSHLPPPTQLYTLTLTPTPTHSPTHPPHTNTRTHRCTPILIQTYHQRV